MDIQINTEAQAKILAARSHLVRGYTFFGHLLLSRLTMVEDSTCPTMATDGRTVWYSPAWVNAQWTPHLIFTLAHEVMHCVLDHPGRTTPEMDLDLANQAADYSVNGHLIDIAGLTPPEGALYRADLAGNSYENNYRILVKERGDRDGDDQPDDQPEPDQGDQGDDQGQGEPDSPDNPPVDDDGDQGDGAGDGRDYPADPSGCGGFIPAGGTIEERAEDSAEWKASTLTAAMAAEGMGDLPADIARLVDSIRNPVESWETVLRDWMDGRGGAGESWSPPNEAFAHLGLTLPTEEAPSLGEVGFFVDVSGSMDQEALELLSDNIAGIFEELKPERVYVVYVNTEVKGVEIFEGGEDFHLAAQSGGGTDFRPGFDWLAAEGIEPVGVIYFTDLDCTRFPEEPAYPVLWASTAPTASAPPFGEVINLR